ncbi:MAG: hypothetical protein C4527_29110 [Candidatus Omnitrophota bacterium]|jgi:uncharacterized Zn-finger protein|nr:MAG: hypothetical protein C4527_29110 [Candidatus Omnitrophota bacterium]
MKRMGMTVCYFLILSEIVFLLDIGGELWAVTPRVEVEEDILTYRSPDNGSGPLWCYGAPVMARDGERVFLSINETGEDIPPLCNTRWRLFERTTSGWTLHAAADSFREREPCPLALLSNQSLFLSINPSTQPAGVQYGPCDPQLLRFSCSSPQDPPASIHPAWSEETYFTDHSYRGIAADSDANQLLALNIHAKTGDQFWCLRDDAGKWIANGKIAFPIRSCYPQVALRRRAGYVMAIGDIVEPIEEWRVYKKEKTGREWDYVFRRLFFCWSPDLAKTNFGEPIEIETVDATAGHISNLDLWLANDGAAYLLYLKSPVQNTLMRDRFFPDRKMTTSLECAVVKDGTIEKKFTITCGGEGLSTPQPHYARFHATPDGRLYAVTFVSGVDRSGTAFQENQIQQILPAIGKPVAISFKDPFRSFFTATERGGSKPSDLLDLYGIGSQGNTLRYARVRLVNGIDR